MNNQKKILYNLMEYYLAHRISAESFSDSFVDAYYETKGDLFSPPEKSILSDLVEWLKRFSQFEEDIRAFPGVYIDAKKMYDLVKKAWDDLIVCE